MEETRQESADQLLEIGFHILPLTEGGKSPHKKILRKDESSENFESKWFETLWIENPKEASRILKNFWIDHPTANIGIYTHKLLIIDCDNEKGKDWAYNNLDTPFSVRTGKGLHLYFRPPRTGEVPKSIMKGSKEEYGIDVLTGIGKYVVAPNSYHSEKDKKYDWVSGKPEKLSKVPQISKDKIKAVQAYLDTLPVKNTGKKSERPQIDIHKALSWFNITYEFKGSHKHFINCPFPDHDDQNPSFRIAPNKNIFHCSCTNKGDSLDFIGRMIGVLKQGDRLNSSSMKQVFEFLSEKDPEFDSKYQQTEEQIRLMMYRMNQEFFFLRSSGHPIYQIKGDQTIEPMPVRNFMISFPDETIDDRPVSDIWLNHPERPTYKQIVFRPGEEITSDQFNMFRGWPIEPDEGECPYILRHIREVICAGNSAVSEWVLDWFAHIFQRPFEVVGSSIGIKGVPGTGKSTLYEIFAKLLVNYATLADTIETITGRFNIHLLNKLLVCLEEATWGGSKKSANILKNRITATKLSYEIKGGSQFTDRNYCRYMALSNEDHFLSLDPDDRRWLILEVPEKYAEDDSYFVPLRKHIPEELPHLMHFLLNRKIVNDLRKVPNTDAKTRLKQFGMNPTEEWFFQCLIEGQISFINEQREPETLLSFENWIRSGFHEVPLDRLHQSWVLDSRKTAHTNSSKNAFGTAFKKLIGPMNMQRVRKSDGYYYKIPYLESCRAIFADRFKTTWNTFCVDQPKEYIDVANTPDSYKPNDKPFN